MHIEESIKLDTSGRTVKRAFTVTTEDGSYTAPTKKKALAMAEADRIRIEENGRIKQEISDEAYDRAYKYGFFMMRNKANGARPYTYVGKHCGGEYHYGALATPVEDGSTAVAFEYMGRRVPVTFSSEVEGVVMSGDGSVIGVHLKSSTGEDEIYAAGFAAGGVTDGDGRIQNHTTFACTLVPGVGPGDFTHYTG